MKDIKFRYTVKRENGFVFSETFSLEEIENGDMITWRNANSIGFGANISIDQYIGKNDRCGKEIYEGDIVELSCGCCDYIIVWDNGKLCWWPGNAMFSLVHGKNIDVWEQELTVVGNIHQSKPHDGKDCLGPGCYLCDEEEATNKLK